MFKDWLKQQESFVVSPSIVDDEGNNAEKVVAITKKHPGAMPTYNSDDLPPTAKNGYKSKKLSKKV